MPATSAKRLLRYPLGTETPDVPRDLGYLVADLEAEVGHIATRSILDVGVLNNTRAGRVLTPADFTGLGLSVPIGLWNLSDANDSSGNANHLTNKGAIPYGKGVTGAAGEAAVLAGSTAQAFYRADTGAADPFRLKTGSWGAWLRTAKRLANQAIITKHGNADTTATKGYDIRVSGSSNVGVVQVSNGATVAEAIGVTDIADDRWHFVVGTHDGDVVRLYVDGAFEASVALSGPINPSAGPFNIGSRWADAAGPASFPHFGRIDEAFVTADVLTEEQIRLLMSVKIAHGAPRAPRSVRSNLRRLKRGPVLAQADFTAAPLRLYNLDNNGVGWHDDIGTQNADLGGTGDPEVAGPNGAKWSAMHFNGSSQYLSASDAGLPATTTARSFGAWFKTTATGEIVGWGTIAAGQFHGMRVSATGALGVNDNTVTVDGSIVNDGQWHWGVVVLDNAAADGLKTKVYLDGKLTASSTSMAGASLALAGATGFVVGRRNGATPNYFTGSIGRAFVTNYAMAADEVANLYAKPSALVGSLVVPTLDEQTLDQIVQGMDATNLYVLGDVRKRISGRVNADGSVAEAVGGDFRVVKTGTGLYTVYWAPGTWTAPPVLTFGTHERNRIATFEGNVGGTAFSMPVAVTQTGDAVYSDRSFSFTAEGRGPIPSQHQIDLAVAA